MKKLSMINEHLWSGIIKRSETGERRKEDSHMSEVVDYLNNHYEYHPCGITDKKKIVEGRESDSVVFLSRIVLTLKQNITDEIRIQNYNEESYKIHNYNYAISFFLKHQETYDDDTINRINTLKKDFSDKCRIMGDDPYHTFFNVKNEEMIYKILDEIIELFSTEESLVRIKP